VGLPTVTRTNGWPNRLATKPLAVLTQARCRNQHATSRLPEADGYRRGDALGVRPADVHVQPETPGTTGRSEAGRRRISRSVGGFELTQVGHDVTVLEARTRPGGRVHTLRDPFADGLYAEAGAARIPNHQTFPIGLHSHRVTAMSESERINFALEYVETIYPGMRTHFEGGVTKCWDEDEWARGVASYYKPGQFSSLLPRVARPEG